MINKLQAVMEKVETRQDQMGQFQQRDSDSKKAVNASAKN